MHLGLQRLPQTAIINAYPAYRGEGETEGRRACNILYGLLSHMFTLGTHVWSHYEHFMKDLHLCFSSMVTLSFYVIKEDLDWS